MNKYRQLDKIIQDNLPAIQSGQETIDSVLCKFSKEASVLRPRLEAALWLVNTDKAMEPREGFIASSRSYLEHRIAALPSRNFWQRLATRFTPQRWVFNLAAPVILIALLTLVINSLFLTARLSIPGDPFYSTKLIVEDVQLIFTFNPEAKADLYIQFSRERTTEFVELVLDGDYEYLPAAASRIETELIASLRSLNHLSTPNPGVEVPMVAKLRETLSNEIFLLDMLRITSPSSAQPGIDLAIQVAQNGVRALH